MAQFDTNRQCAKIGNCVELRQLEESETLQLGDNEILQLGEMTLNPERPER